MESRKVGEEVFFLSYNGVRRGIVIKEINFEEGSFPHYIVQEEQCGTIYALFEHELLLSENLLEEEQKWYKKKFEQGEYDRWLLKTNS